MTNQEKKVPELRFPEFDGEWEENKLGNLTLLLKDGSHGTHKDVENGPWLLSAKNIKNNKININSDDRKISKEDFDTIYRNYKLKKYDIALSIVGTIGRTAIIRNEDNIAFQRSVALIRFNKSMNSTFMIQLMNTNQFQKNLKTYQVVSAQPGIYLGDLRKLLINYCSVSEQQKIGEFFSKLDRQIELEEQKLAKLEEQKKGYMQKIFSQELRFKDENGNEYPEWKETLVKEIASIGTGNKDTQDAIENGEYDFYVRSPKIHKINSYSFDGEAVLTVGDGVGVGKVFHYVKGKFDYHQRVYKISDFKNYDAILFYYYFSTHFLREAQKYNAKTSVDSVRKDMISNMKIPDLDFDEQKRISGFLSKLDILIDKQNIKISELKSRKQVFLQKMFV